MKVYHFSEEKNDANTSCSLIPITAIYRRYTNSQFARENHAKFFGFAAKAQDKEYHLGVIREEKYDHDL